MASIITGLFRSQNQSADISKDIENAGFHDSNYIMYLHKRPISKEVKTSIWRSFFNDKTQLEDDSLVISVKVKTEEEQEKISKIFQNNHVVHQNYFENVKFKNAKSLAFLKKLASIRAKAAVYSSPEIRHRSSAVGMSSEVSFGKG
ncbi:hypothetical protein [Chryseobacterium sp. MP_3.2]|uniref:hypothetical protein n=1 Tax=Chryseobacterium sp. MP_3.2 TaxID=3071712 RepID=UPI002E048E0C|nr:hypothetical protein [Chryseobacterium sp. MP_3.2]